MRNYTTFILALLVFPTAGTGLVFARGGGGSSSGSHSSGSGSHSSGASAHSSGGSSSGKSVHVSGYTRKDGTYVAPHDRAAPGSGGGSARTTARTSANLQPRTTARGEDDDETGARTAAGDQARTTARGQDDNSNGVRTTKKRKPAEQVPDDEDGVARAAGFQPGMAAGGLPASASEPAAGVEDELSIERARRIRAEEEAENLRKQLQSKRVADAEQVDLEKAEKLAHGMLVAAKALIHDGKHEQAVKMLKSLIQRYPNTKAAAEARKLPGVPSGS